ncbi:MAG TPA: quinolinate synthase NadA [Chitinivibrionales bacterium]|nr:quinolinate synthase NadA [Chitinivibrionales bacterium]
MPPLIQNIQTLKRKKNAVILAHTYQPAEVQDVADYVGDSYGLSVEATKTKADIIIFCGVMFMAETAAILNPKKQVIIPEPGAGCPMADMITAEELVELKKKHPGHLVICYVNSTADIKALSDICCTSSNAVKIVSQLPKEQGIIFVPDKHLGGWVQEKTGRTMVLWDGFCPTHVRVMPDMIKQAKALHPDAAVLIHPEAPKASRYLADQVLSTGGMCDFVKKDGGSEYLIATETGIIHTLQKQNPAKKFYPVTEHALCPNMKKTSLELVAEALEGAAGQVVSVPPDIAEKARRSLTRMLEMSR